MTDEPVWEPETEDAEVGETEEDSGTETEEVSEEVGERLRGRKRIETAGTGRRSERVSGSRYVVRRDSPVAEEDETSSE